MAGMLEYLKRRGDICFSQTPPNPVDALIFSTLSYVRYKDFVSELPSKVMYLKQVAESILEFQDAESLVRTKQDLELLALVGETERFKNVGLTFYQDVFLPEEETQFAAITFLLEDGSAFLTFRGTDRTLIGWKEDFNLIYQESIPAQRYAVEYVKTFAESYSMPIRLSGHSKGGNLAVYAGAKCGKSIQSQILEVYNQDGPGFTEQNLSDEEYCEITPKIKTYVPQSSLIGMLLEHEEEYMVIRSCQLGVLQNDPYSWEVLGKDFIYLNETTPDSRFIEQTLKLWLETMSMEQRNELVDVVFDILASGKAIHTNEILHPQNLKEYYKSLSADEHKRNLLAKEITSLLRSARRK